MARKTNFEANGNNYYRVTATVGHDSDGKPIRKQFYGSSKKEAEAKKDEYLLNINMGLAVGYDKALFGNVFKVWFDNVLRPSIALSSYRRYETDYRLRIKDSKLAYMKLSDVKAINIQEYYNNLLEANTANTVCNINKLLSSFFDYCIKSDLIIKKPLLAVELPKDKIIKTESRVLNKSDIQKLIEAAQENSDYFIFVFALFTGLRQGDAYCKHKLKIFSNNFLLDKKAQFSSLLMDSALFNLRVFTHITSVKFANFQ